ncbi:MAG: alpha/beta fold hydrolase [Ignavibacteriae bacterium]|nr:alpha/beta fold hydrolase [Ignavibacteriota bacterium]
MRLRLYSLFILVFLVCITGHSQTARDTLVLMNDGVTLDALYVLPTTPAPTGGFPALVWVHGFAGSKEENRSYAQAYAARGYICVAYSVRGQGASGGEFDFFTSPRVTADLKAFIDMAAALPGANPERVGVIGASQGGIHAWSAAAHNLGARAVVSIIANGRFDENWLENNALNWTFASAIVAATIRFSPGAKDSVNRAISTGNYAYLRSMLGGYTTTGLESATSTPTLILVSYFDGFFNQSSALKQFARIAGPKRIVTYPGGHALPSHPIQRSFVTQLQDRWLEYWLKDQIGLGSVAGSDSAVIMYDAITNLPHVYSLRDSAIWLGTSAPLPGNISPRTFYPSNGVLELSAPTASETRTISYSRVTGSTPLVYRSEPLAQDMVLGGRPCEVQIMANGSGASYQVVANLYDFDPATGKSAQLARGHYQVASNTSGDERLRFALTSVAATIRAGHRLELRIHGGMALFPGANDFGNYVLGPVDPSTNTVYLGGTDPSNLTVYTITGPTGIDASAQLPNTPQLGVHPNPVGLTASPWVTVTLPFAQSDIFQLELYDALGRRMTHSIQSDSRLPSTIQINTTSLSNGIYTVLVRTRDTWTSGRIIIAR